MTREYIIFSSAGNGNGAARVEKIQSGYRISIDIDGHIKPKKDEVIKAYLIDSYMPGAMHLLGSIEGGRESFSVPDYRNFKGIVILNKNVSSKEVKPLFWGARKGRDIDYEQLFSSFDTQNDDEKEPSVPSADCLSSKSGEKEEKTERIIEEAEKMDGFEAFGGGSYEWHKVTGYYGLYSFDIIKHVLSIDSVKKAIEEKGFYYTGVKEMNEAKHIVIAVSCAENPFTGHDKYVGTLTNKDTLFYTIGCGVDDLGEFFLKPE